MPEWLVLRAGGNHLRVINLEEVVEVYLDPGQPEHRRPEFGIYSGADPGPITVQLVTTAPSSEWSEEGRQQIRPYTIHLEAEQASEFLNKVGGFGHAT